MNSELVVFADGPSSLARGCFGLGFVRSPDNTAFGAVYEIESRNNPIDYYEYYFGRDVAPYGFGWIFPKKHLLNVGVACLLSKLQRNIRDHLNYFVTQHAIASKRIANRRILRFAAGLIPVAVQPGGWLRIG